MTSKKSGHVFFLSRKRRIVRDWLALHPRLRGLWPGSETGSGGPETQTRVHVTASRFFVLIQVLWSRVVALAVAALAVAVTEIQVKACIDKR